MNIEKTKPIKISGWLIIPALSLILGPIATIFGMWTGYKLIKMFSPEHLYNPIFGLLVSLDVLKMFFVIFVATQFFKKKKSTVKLMIILLLASIIIGFIEMILGFRFLNYSLDWDFAKIIVSPLLGAAIWIPYFLKSKRVKKTFVNA